MGGRGPRGLIAALVDAARELDPATHAFYLRRDRPWRGAPWTTAAPEAEALRPFLSPPGRALDLGCGGGRHAVHLARAGWRVWGIDLYPWTVRRARARAHAAGVADRVRLVRGPVCARPALPGPVELALDVLGPASDLRPRDLARYAALVAAALAPRGRFVVHTYLTDAELAPLRGHLTLLEASADPLSRWLVYAARAP